MTDEKKSEGRPVATQDDVPQEHMLGKRRHHFGSHAPPPPLESSTRSRNGRIDSQTPAPISAAASRSSDSDEATLAPVAAHPKSASSEHAATTARTNDVYQRTHHPRWKWFGLPPPGKRLELGFVANAVQLVGATSFQVSVICGLPGVLAASGSTGGVAQQGYVESTWIGAYWASEWPLSLPMTRTGSNRKLTPPCSPRFPLPYSSSIWLAGVHLCRVDLFARDADEVVETQLDEHRLVDVRA